MDNYICSACGVSVSSDEKPEKCLNCEATGDTLIKVQKKEDTIVTEQEVVHESKAIGFNASPQKILSLLKYTTLPVKSKPYFEQIYFNVDEKVGVQNFTIANGETLLQVIDIKKEYFDEVWGVGKLPIKSAKSLEYMDVLSTYDKTSIQIDTENKVLIHNAGLNAKFANNPESIEHISQCKMSVNEIFKTFDTEKFVPQFTGDIKFNYVVTINVAELAVLLKVAAKQGIRYYPITLSTNELKAGVGDMSNPTKGAFDLKIPVDAEKSVFPPEPIVVEAGSSFKNVISNMEGQIQIHFAGSELPLWVTGTVTHKKKNTVEGKEVISEEVVGKVGYVISPRTADPDAE